MNLSAYLQPDRQSAAALEEARKAIALDPKSDRAWFQKGRAEERGGDLEAAAESLNPAIVLNARASSLLLRHRRRVPPARFDGGEPQGPGDVQAAGSGGRGPRQEAPRRSSAPAQPPGPE